ncbi:Lrp/AsnC family transcriptional regulator [Labedaea rhizosphaerae]|uniref:DNA-binding Lrp family transcriptional regulator n=1 Tax=Labedaea rhizosphaerae TaxID=598644 RepID=A0A4R6RW09_LABRH|nr:AsnC family transcriptional regulator [Labedaea rhizosphaerae]TDP91170.1 DNA-binding Lrp family transcriptional regulator [Labedaea rhizosphaerae]
MSYRFAVDSDYDDLDRQLVHALHVAARAPFSRIAEVLGVSDQTVARRYTRLRSTGALRVLGAPDPRSLGEVAWFVRLHCTPDAAEPLAAALAKRPDTSWVRLTSGGTELVCVTRAPLRADGGELLLRTLPRTARVVTMSAHCLLHVFFGGRRSPIDKVPALSQEQVAALAEPESRPEPVTLTVGDRRLLAELAKDARTPVPVLAEATGWSATTVRRRMAELHARGAFFYDVEFDRDMFAMNVSAMLWLSVHPAELDRAGRELAEHPEVAFAAATTGPTNLYASLATSGVEELYRYLTERVSVLPGVTAVESAPVMRSVKGSGPLPTG